MGNSIDYFQVQDSIPAKRIEITPISEQEYNSNLNVERKTIEMVSLRTITVDSARLYKPKVVRPIIKTIPFVPLNDSLEQPVFNVLDGNFILHDSSTFFDGFHFNPLNPDLKFQQTETFTTAVEGPVEADNLVIGKELLTKDLLSKDRYGNSVGFRSTDWMLGIILFALILFGWLRVGFSRYFQNAIQASYNYFTARRIFEEANVTRSRVFVFMNLLFFITLSLFLSQLLEYHHFSIFKLHGILLFLLCFGSIIALYSGKSILLYLLDFIFLTRGGFSSYVFTVFLYNKMVGFLLLPIVSILPFVPAHITSYVFMAGGLVIIILYLFRVFKGLQLGIKNRLSISYLILYLCALEILPVLILYKVIEPYI